MEISQNVVQRISEELCLASQGKQETRKERFIVMCISARVKGSDPFTAPLLTPLLTAKTSAVMDGKTRKMYSGNSGEKPDDIHPDLLAKMPEQSMEKWSVNNCAEFAACNKALNDGAEMKNLQIHTVDVKTGTPEPRCANCQVTTQGARASSD